MALHVLERRITRGPAAGKRIPTGLLCSECGVVTPLTNKDDRQNPPLNCPSCDHRPQMTPEGQGWRWNCRKKLTKKGVALIRERIKPSRVL